jgi:transcriptional regulator with XRE-family HTH domain
VEKVRLGSAYRAIRIELRLRQEDVARQARVCQQTVSRIERGRLGSLTVDTLLAVAGALEADLRVTLEWRGAKLPRLLDRRHARLQDAVARLLMDSGWDVTIEETFNHFGERGSVDILAWRADVQALLVIEIKSELVDLQDTVASMDRKLRVVPQIVRRDRGWQARSIAGVLVLPDAKLARSAVAEHAALMGAAFPARTLEVRRWIGAPAGRLRGIWFVANTPGGSVARSGGPTRRVYKRRKPARPANEREPKARSSNSGL